MSLAAAPSHSGESIWVRFWHKPVRAERLATMRILLAAFLLADQWILYAPNIAEFFGPAGCAPAGLYDGFQLQNWRLTYLFFGTDNLYAIYSAFWLWVAVTAAFLIGWETRWLGVLLWFLTRCFHERHPNIIYGADNVLQVALFLLMLSPCGAALSIDALRKRRKGQLQGPAFVRPWSLRLIQIQLCVIYCSSGLAKLQGDYAADGGWKELFTGGWWDGTAIHYVLNDTTMSRWSYAQLAIPFFITMPLTYASVWWETLFPILVLNRWTRALALAMGILFHLGIALTVDIAWFGFYMLSMYGVWIPDRFWRRFDGAAENSG